MNRRLARDQKERGYGQEDVMYRYEHHVTPSYERYIKPLRYEADLIVPNNNNFDKALDLVTHYLKLKMLERSIDIYFSA